MKNTIKASALCLAGILALSACGTSEAAPGSAESSSPSDESATPTPTLAVGQDQYTPEELEAALAAILADRKMAGEVISEQDLDPLLERAPDQLAGVVITPQQCDVLAGADVAGVLEDANLAVIMLNETDTLTIASHPDSSVLGKQAADNNRLLKDCAHFQMEANGQVVSADVEALDASTDGQMTQAYRTSLTAADQVTDTVQINSMSGTTNVQVSVTGALASDAESIDAIAEAQVLINDVLAELAK